MSQLKKAMTLNFLFENFVNLVTLGILLMVLTCTLLLAEKLNIRFLAEI